jgi:hypothetical protein
VKPLAKPRTPHQHVRRQASRRERVPELPVADFMLVSRDVGPAP